MKTFKEVIRSLPSPLSGLDVEEGIGPVAGGLQFRDVAPMICGVVDNGVCPDDPRVLVRLNEATRMILNTLIPVGGMVSANVTAIETYLILPPQMENAIEAVPVDAKVRGSSDIVGGWYEIVNQSTYLDPFQHHDNPLVDLGLWPLPGDDQEILHRVYQYPGLEPNNAVVMVTGAKRFIPTRIDEDYVIVQNIQALKDMILSIERNENGAKDESLKYRQSALELLQGEVKQHQMDPRNYMRRKAEYNDDLVTFAPNTLGWVRANIALDIEAALKTGKSDLTWSINKVEERLMRRAIWKDTITQIQTEVTGGYIYFPVNVQSVLAIDLDGNPIPIRSQFFEHLENGPGMFSSHPMLKDMGDEYFPVTMTTRRKYLLNATCSEGSCINAVCKLRWLPKKPNDLMVIKNYEAIRQMMSAKFLEEAEKWQEAQANAQSAIDILQKEVNEYLSGIRHTVHVQCFGFGLSDVGRIN
jgi:hypothetical protein